MQKLIPEEIRMKLFSLAALVTTLLLPTLGYSAVIKIEAESFVAQGGGSANKTSDRPGTSGGEAVIAWDDKDHWIEWKVEVPETADYQVVLRLAGNRDWTVYRELKVDGKVPSEAFAKIPFTRSGGWGRKAEDWKAVTVTGADGKPATVRLEKGQHTLRLTNLGGEDGNGGANIDVIVLHKPGEASPY
jgi:hypothetical protein